MKKDTLKLKAVVASEHCNHGEPIDYLFRFELVESAAFQYGNGKALSIYATEGNKKEEHWQTIDVRYSKIDPIDELCHRVLKNYYGENLKSVEVVK